MPSRGFFLLSNGMQVSITREQVLDFGAYEEDDVLTVGLKLAETPFEHLLIQIDTPASELRAERQGAYVELGERTAFYGGLARLQLHQDGVLEVGLDPIKSNEVESVRAQLPFPMRAETHEIVRRLVETFEAYPPLLPAGRPR